ncbi:hypothetical protein Q5425_38130 [Amycolatopsis sp. A133]|uniref:hypothetical protein n=1 Tax=Amycolatopsis sp. A133 TaxID=3064472 RepID=UPI0027FA8CEF|nr:hypothetical protein [Amycolatopsis sp. A133]MDQ7809577.1 hypothetical protein [Amycolatopsis sp. A133]
MKLTVYGASWCADAAAERRVRELQDGARRIPTIVWEDGSFLVEPSDAELSGRL